MKKKINKINRLEPISNEPTMITPDTDVTKLPYQNYITNQEYYYRLQASCFELDNSINEIVSRKLSGNNIRNMSDEDAIECFKALENAKFNRTKQYLDLANHLANDDFYRKMLQIERMKSYEKDNLVDIQPIEQTTIETPSQENTKEISELDREKREGVIRLLQESIMKKLENKET